MRDEHYQTSRGNLDRFRTTKVDDAKDIQYHAVEGFADETFSEVPMIFPHGFSSHSPRGSNLYGLAQGGSRDRALLIGGEHPDKRQKNLPEGATALYDADGKVIRLFKDKNEWDGGNKPFTMLNVTAIKMTAKDDIAIGLDNGRWIRIRKNRIDLSIKKPDEDAPYKVATEAGLSTVLFARID